MGFKLLLNIVCKQEDVWETVSAEASLVLHSLSFIHPPSIVCPEEIQLLIQLTWFILLGWESSAPAPRSPESSSNVLTPKSSSSSGSQTPLIYFDFDVSLLLLASKNFGKRQKGRYKFGPLEHCPLDWDMWGWHAVNCMCNARYCYGFMSHLMLPARNSNEADIYLRI